MALTQLTIQLIQQITQHLRIRAQILLTTLPQTIAQAVPQMLLKTTALLITIQATILLIIAQQIRLLRSKVISLKAATKLPRLPLQCLCLQGNTQTSLSRLRIYSAGIF